MKRKGCFAGWGWRLNNGSWCCWCLLSTGFVLTLFVSAALEQLKGQGPAVNLLLILWQIKKRKKKKKKTQLNYSWACFHSLSAITWPEQGHPDCHANLNAKLMRPQPHIKNDRQLRNAVRRRNSTPTGYQYRVISPKNKHTSIFYEWSRLPLYI